MAESEKLAKAATQFIDASNNGGLADLIFGVWPDSDTEDERLGVAIRLHNEGAINLIDVSLIPTEMSGVEFFSGQHFFCLAIPQLRADPLELMHFADKLIQRGGDDLAATSPNTAFLEWCKNDIGRAQIVIDMAKRQNELANKFLTFALIAKASTLTAKEFTLSPIKQHRLSGMTALGRMNYDDENTAIEAIKAATECAENQSDDLHRANAVTAILSIYAKANTIQAGFIATALNKICVEPGPFLIHQCVDAIWQYASALDRSSVELLSNLARHVETKNKGTVRDLTLAIDALFSSPHTNVAKDLLFELLTRDEDPIDPHDLKHVGRKLVADAPSLFLDVVVSLFLSGKTNACEWVGKALGDLPLPDGLQSVLIQRQLNGIQLFFLCRKAVGFLFLRPVEACRFILCVMEIADETTSNRCGELIFDPLALNYSSSVTDYLKSIPPNAPMHSAVENTLDKWDTYIAGIRASHAIKELKPSERQRFIERKRTQNMMRLSHKEAEKRSVFLSLVHRSVVLNGTKTVTHVRQQDGSIKPMDMKLETHSVAVEVPRLSILEEHELNFLLRVFRVEKLKT